MRHYQEPTFNRIEVSDIVSTARERSGEGCRFIAINATTTDDGVELLYVYRKKEGGELEGYTAHVDPGAHVESITGVYPEAFVFENETHDLFGIDIDGIAIDYAGDFYRVNVAYPMNPAAADAAAAQGGDGDE